MKNDQNVKAIFANEIRQAEAERKLLQQQFSELEARLHVVDSKLAWLNQQLGTSGKNGANQTVNDSLFSLAPTPEPTFRDHICNAIAAADGGATPGGIRDALRAMGPKMAERVKNPNRIYGELNKMKGMGRIVNRDGRWFLATH